MWPPPAPPSRPDHTQVPQGLRPARSNLPHRDGWSEGHDTSERASNAGDSTSGDRPSSGQYPSGQPGSGRGPASGRSSPTGSIGQQSVSGQRGTPGHYPLSGSGQSQGGPSGAGHLGDRNDTESIGQSGDGSQGEAPPYGEAEGVTSAEGQSGVESMDTDVTTTPGQGKLHG